MAETDGIPYVWFKGLTETKDKERLASVLKNNKHTFRILLSILSERYESTEKRGYKEEDYNASGWDRAQAFRNGKMAAYLEVAELLDFVIEKDTKKK